MTSYPSTILVCIFHSMSCIPVHVSLRRMQDHWLFYVKHPAICLRIPFQLCQKFHIPRPAKSSVEGVKSIRKAPKSEEELPKPWQKQVFFSSCSNSLTFAGRPFGETLKPLRQTPLVSSTKHQTIIVHIKIIKLHQAHMKITKDQSFHIWQCVKTYSTPFLFTSK